MAQKPLRPCRHAGCYQLTADGYCPAHKPKETRNPEAASWRWLYQTKLWLETLRPGQLLREPFCRACAKLGRRTPGTDVDHIDPHLGDWDKFSDPDNLETLCHSCHSKKTWAENHKNSRGKTDRRP